jgi:phosphoribosylformylglycinamidine synthase subunit PurL
MVGRLPEVRRAGRLGWANTGDQIALVGGFHPSRDGSEIAKLYGSAPAGALPAKDASAIRDAHARVRNGVRDGTLSSAHDIAEGGIAVALAECCIASGLGAEVTLPGGLDPFGEDLGTAFIVSGAPGALAGLEIIGEVGGGELVIAGLLSLPLSELTTAHAGGLSSLLS